MNDKAQPHAILLADYKPPPFAIVATDLLFEIGDGETRVENRMRLERRVPGQALVLDGQGLILDEVSVDGRVLASNEYGRDADSLTLYDLPDRCEVKVINRIYPEKNTALEGLYKSSGMYCTQCEAEGFRKITYYQDRPDVLSVFTTTIVADRQYPILLSNGNLTADEVLKDGRRRVTWSDPFPKPSYLFALVAGDLALLEDSFRTVSGREVTLQIYSEPHNIDQCHYAMDALKRSMRWDEETFGREYDLDIFMIVAVDDFNMGAMENKGLNVFNTSCVLATPDTATDQAYLRVEAVVAHEYFHNWSGNRVTCRDWFQLSLKEGFTVFRDAEFSADMNSSTVKRIEDVNQLRSVQFAEDAGPLAHPVRPASYIEISNFYTPTVYEKGAEVVRMVHTIVGPEAFREGSDLYFERHDGQAVTTEDFLRAMQDASGKDLTQFQRWYDQAGTPVLEVSRSFSNGILRLGIAQRCPATPGQEEKAPFHVPVAIGLLDADGASLVTDALHWQSDSEVEIRGDTLLLHLRTTSTAIEFPALAAEPQISFLRGFSAPVKVIFERPPESLGFLAIRDSDGFASWDALQTLLVAEIARLGKVDPPAIESAAVSGTVLDLFASMLALPHSAAASTAEGNFLLAAKLTIPSENYLFEQVERIDVDRICRARDRLVAALAAQFLDQWSVLHDACEDPAGYSVDSLSMSRRALKNCALGYLTQGLSTDILAELLEGKYRVADNLTDRRAVLIALVNGLPDSELTSSLLTDFYERWHDEALVVNQWFSLQASSVHCDLERLRTLVTHPAFTFTNPNKVRSVLAVFAGQNQRNFHVADGSGYLYLADRVLELNGINPQMAAALAKPLTRWRRYAGGRPQLMQAALRRIEAGEDLSTDVFEIVSKSLQ